MKTSLRLADSEYFAHPAMSNSRMTEFKRQLEGNFRLPSITDKAADLGHLFHGHLFEPHRMDEIFAECKTEITTKEKYMVHNMAIKGSQHHTYQYMKNHPDTVYEEAIFFDLFGIPFKTKPDMRLHTLLLDGKSTTHGTYDGFLASFDDYGYWRQAFNYLTGSNGKDFIFLGVSKRSGHEMFSVDSRDYADKIRVAGEEMEWLVSEYVKAQEKAKKDEEMRLKLIEILFTVKE